MRAPSVKVLGAGLAGLGFAKTYGSALVYEAKSHVGGHVYSHAQDGWHWDEGAHICHSTDSDFLKLISNAAGIINKTERSIVKNYANGVWFGYPVQAHLSDLPADVARKAAASLPDESNAHGENRSQNYEAWCRQEYGDYLTDNFYRVYTDKYWRVPMAELGVDWIKGRVMKKKEKPVFRSFLYPKLGFFDFFRPLYEGVDVLCDHRVVNIDLKGRQLHFENSASDGFDTLVSTIPLPSLVRLLGNQVPSDVVAASQRLKWTKLLCINISLKPRDLPDMHWFYIYDHDIPPSRVSIPSRLAHMNHGEPIRIQCEVFCSQDEDFDEGKLAHHTLRSISKILDFNGEADVLAVHTKVVNPAYVVATIDRDAASATILSWLESRGIRSIGLYGKWRYCWSDAAFKQGVRLAQELLNRSTHKL